MYMYNLCMRIDVSNIHVCAFQINEVIDGDKGKYFK